MLGKGYWLGGNLGRKGYALRESLVWAGVGIVLAGFVARGPLSVVALGAGGAGLLMAALLWPPVVYPALAFAVPFGPGLSLGAFTVGSADLLVGLIVAVWMGYNLAQRRWPTLRAEWTIPLVLFFLAQVVSLREAWSWTAALPELIKWGEIIALYVVTVDILRTWRRHWERLALWIAGGLVVAAAAEAALGLVQFLFRIGPPQFIILGRFLRAYGTFAQPNPYAGYLGLVLPLAVSLSLHALHVGVWPDEERPLRQWLGRAVALVGAALTGIIGMGLLASWSRGGWLGMVAALSVVIGLRSRRAVLLSVVLAFLLLSTVVLGVVGALPPAVQERFQGLEDWTLFLRPVELRSIRVTGENFALVERMAHWWAAWAMWLDYPWTGVGAGNYAVAYEAYRMPGWKDPLGHAHNIFLNVMAETGLVGLVAYVLLWGWVYVLALYRLPRTHGWARAVHLGALGGLTHLTVHNLFDNLYVRGMYTYVAILLALLSTSLEGQTQYGEHTSDVPDDESPAAGES